MSPVVKDIISLVQSLVVLAIALGGVLWALFRRTDGKTAEDAVRDATKSAETAARNAAKATEDAERAARLDARTEQIQASVARAIATLDSIQTELRASGEERAVQGVELERLKADLIALRADHAALRLALETDLSALRTHCAECNRTVVVGLTRLARRPPDPEG